MSDTTYYLLLYTFILADYCLCQLGIKLLRYSMIHPEPHIDYLLNYCSVLDCTGLPLITDRVRLHFAEDPEPSAAEERERKLWNIRNEHLLRVVNNIRDTQQCIEFLEKWLLRCSNPSTQISKATPGEHIHADVLIKDEMAALEVRRILARSTLMELSTAIDVLLRHKLAGVPYPPPPQTTGFNPFDPPLTLIRIWNDDSHSPYTESLGFRCGNWRNCQPANSFSELQSKAIVDLQTISNHCGNTARPSSWISFSDSASWILAKFVGLFSSNIKNPRVAVLSVAKMDRLRIPWHRSDLLVQDLGGNPYSPKKDSVDYAWAGHYLVYGWIPSQCIIKVFTLRQFQDRCQARNILKGYSPNQRYAVPKD